MHACIDNTALLIRLFTSMRIHLQVATSYTLVLQQTHTRHFGRYQSITAYYSKHTTSYTKMHTHDISVAIRVLQRDFRGGERLIRRIGEQSG